MRSLIPAILVIAVLALPVSVSSRRWTNARSELARANAQLDTTTVTIARIDDLSSRQQQVESHEKPKQAIIAQVNGVLARIGIPQTALDGVSPLGDEPHQAGRGGTAPYRAQSVQVTLHELTVQESARFLQHWREAYPIWEPQQISLTHVRGDRNDRFNLTLTLRAIYLANASPLMEN